MMTREEARAQRFAARARLLVGTVSALALSAGVSGAALAQTAAAGDEVKAEAEVIVVTGFRAALQNAINTKKTLAVISETVSAEDIGKLPDVSIAESIARLPGLAAERVDGRAARISVRGLGPDFTTTLLNGREQVSTNDGRGIEFDQFPSELINSVNIYKTSEAGLAAQGIAGTADLRTVRPLAYGRRAAVVSARVQTNSLGEVMPDVDPTGYRFTGSYIDQFMDGKVGVALGVAHMVNPNQTQRTEAYDTSTRGAKVQGGGNLGNIQSPGGLKVNASSTVVERTGYMGVLEYKPTDSLSMVLDAYYSTFGSEQNNRGVEVNLGQGVNDGWVRSTVKTTNNYVTEGTFVGRYATRNIFNSTDAEVAALGFKADYDLTERTTLGFDFGYSAATRDTLLMETQPCVGGGCTGGGVPIQYKINSNGAVNLTINENMADPARVLLADPYGWGAQGFSKYATIDDELKTYRFDIKHDLKEGMGMDSIEFGVTYADRRKERTFREGFLRTAGATATVPASAIAGTVDLGFGGLGKVLAFDPRKVIKQGTFKEEISTDWWQGQSDWNVDEKITTVFFKGNIDTEFAGIPTTGNFGIQYIHTDQSSDGFFVGYFFSDGGQNGGIRPVQAGVKYSEVLPSLNLSFEPIEDLFVRVGLGRVLSRQNMQDMRITRQINFNADRIDSLDPYNSPYTGDGGNPLLRPTISRNADISVEKYFGRRGYVSLAAWQKNLETYLKPGGDRYFLDLTGYPSPAWLLPRVPKLQTAFVTTPGNAEGGVLKGLEFALSLPFELFNESLDGFGVYFNVAQNFSDIEYADSRAGRGELPGFSKTTGNLAVYYEKHGFQARVSARYRSEFLQDVINFNADIERRVASAETIVDAQIGYEFPATSPLAGLSAVLQASNLNGEPWVTYYNDPYRGLNYDEYGTTYTFGLTYKF
jgi:iron complex outermembrane recepter protein